MLDAIVTVAATDWSAALGGLVSELEAGKLLFFPSLRFQMDRDEAALLRPTCATQVPQHQPEA